VVRTEGGAFSGTRPVNKPVRYLAISTDGRPEDPPSERDLSVPENLPDSIRRLAQDLSRGKENPGEKIASVIAFFKEGFRYSLKLESYEGHPLEHFLFRSRSGNCEFFASSTALILCGGRNLGF